MLSKLVLVTLQGWRRLRSPEDCPRRGWRSWFIQFCLQSKPACPAARPPDGQDSAHMLVPTQPDRTGDQQQKSAFIKSGADPGRRRRPQRQEPPGLLGTGKSHRPKEAGDRGLCQRGPQEGLPAGARAAQHTWHPPCTPEPQWKPRLWYQGPQWAQGREGQGTCSVTTQWPRFCRLPPQPEML